MSAIARPSIGMWGPLLLAMGCSDGVDTSSNGSESALYSDDRKAPEDASGAVTLNWDGEDHHFPGATAALDILEWTNETDHVTLGLGTASASQELHAGFTIEFPETRAMDFSPVGRHVLAIGPGFPVFALQTPEESYIASSGTITIEAVSAGRISGRIADATLDFRGELLRIHGEFDSPIRIDCFVLDGPAGNAHIRPDDPDAMTWTQAPPAHERCVPYL